MGNTYKTNGRPVWILYLQSSQSVMCSQSNKISAHKRQRHSSQNQRANWHHLPKAGRLHKSIISVSQAHIGSNRKDALLFHDRDRNYSGWSSIWSHPASKGSILDTYLQLLKGSCDELAEIAGIPYPSGKMRGQSQLMEKKSRLGGLFVNSQDLGAGFSESSPSSSSQRIPIVHSPFFQIHVHTGGVQWFLCFSFQTLTAIVIIFSVMEWSKWILVWKSVY